MRRNVDRIRMNSMTGRSKEIKLIEALNSIKFFVNARIIEIWARVCVCVRALASVALGVRANIKMCWSNVHVWHQRFLCED